MPLTTTYDDLLAPQQAELDRLEVEIRSYTAVAKQSPSSSPTTNSGAAHAIDSAATAGLPDALVSNNNDTTEPPVPPPPIANLAFAAAVPSWARLLQVHKGIVAEARRLVEDDAFSSAVPKDGAASDDGQQLHAARVGQLTMHRPWKRPVRPQPARKLAPQTTRLPVTNDTAASASSLPKRVVPENRPDLPELSSNFNEPVERHPQNDDDHHDGADDDDVFNLDVPTSTESENQQKGSDDQTNTAETFAAGPLLNSEEKDFAASAPNAAISGPERHAKKASSTAAAKSTAAFPYQVPLLLAAFEGLNTTYERLLRNVQTLCQCSASSSSSSSSSAEGQHPPMVMMLSLSSIQYWREYLHARFQQCHLLSLCYDSESGSSHTDRSHSPNHPAAGTTATMVRHSAAFKVLVRQTLYPLFESALLSKHTGHEIQGAGGGAPGRFSALGAGGNGRLWRDFLDTALSCGDATRFREVLQMALEAAAEAERANATATRRALATYNDHRRVHHHANDHHERPNTNRLWSYVRQRLLKGTSADSGGGSATTHHGDTSSSLADPLQVGGISFFQPSQQTWAGGVGGGADALVPRGTLVVLWREYLRAYPTTRSRQELFEFLTGRLHVSLAAQHAAAAGNNVMTGSKKEAAAAAAAFYMGAFLDFVEDLTIQCGAAMPPPPPVSASNSSTATAATDSYQWFLAQRKQAAMMQASDDPARQSALRLLSQPHLWEALLLVIRHYGNNDKSGQGEAAATTTASSENAASTSRRQPIRLLIQAVLRVLVCVADANAGQSQQHHHLGGASHQKKKRPAHRMIHALSPLLVSEILITLCTALVKDGAFIEAIAWLDGYTRSAQQLQQRTQHHLQQQQQENVRRSFDNRFPQLRASSADGPEAAVEVMRAGSFLAAQLPISEAAFEQTYAALVALLTNLADSASMAAATNAAAGHVAVEALEAAEDLAAAYDVMSAATALSADPSSADAWSRHVAVNRAAYEEVLLQTSQQNNTTAAPDRLQHAFTTMCAVYDTAIHALSRLAGDQSTSASSRMRGGNSADNHNNSRAAAAALVFGGCGGADVHDGVESSSNSTKHPQHDGVDSSSNSKHQQQHANRSEAARAAIYLLYLEYAAFLTEEGPRSCNSSNNNSNSTTNTTTQRFVEEAVHVLGRGAQFGVFGAASTTIAATVQQDDDNDNPTTSAKAPHHHQDPYDVNVDLLDAALSVAAASPDANYLERQILFWLDVAERHAPIKINHHARSSNPAAAAGGGGVKTSVAGGSTASSLLLGGVGTVYSHKKGGSSNHNSLMGAAGSSAQQHGASRLWFAERAWEVLLRHAQTVGSDATTTSSSATPSNTTAHSTSTKMPLWRRVWQLCSEGYAAVTPHLLLLQVQRLWPPIGRAVSSMLLFVHRQPAALDPLTATNYSNNSNDQTQGGVLPIAAGIVGAAAEAFATFHTILNASLVLQRYSAAGTTTATTNHPSSRKDHSGKSTSASSKNTANSTAAARLDAVRLLLNAVTEGRRRVAASGNTQGQAATAAADSTTATLAPADLRMLLLGYETTMDLIHPHLERLTAMTTSHTTSRTNVAVRAVDVVVFTLLQCQLHLAVAEITALVHNSNTDSHNSMSPRSMLTVDLVRSRFCSAIAALVRLAPFLPSSTSSSASSLTPASTSPEMLLSSAVSALLQHYMLFEAAVAPEPTHYNNDDVAAANKGRPSKPVSTVGSSKALASGIAGPTMLDGGLAAVLSSGTALMPLLVAHSTLQAGTSATMMVPTLVPWSEATATNGQFDVTASRTAAALAPASHVFQPSTSASSSFSAPQSASRGGALLTPQHRLGCLEMLVAAIAATRGADAAVQLCAGGIQVAAGAADVALLASCIARLLLLPTTKDAATPATAAIDQARHALDQCAPAVTKACADLAASNKTSNNTANNSSSCFQRAPEEDARLGGDYYGPEASLCHAAATFAATWTALEARGGSAAQQSHAQEWCGRIRAFVGKTLIPMSAALSH